MSESAVGKIICFRVTGEPRVIRPGEWFINRAGELLKIQGGKITELKHTPVELINSALVTIAEPPERFYRDQPSLMIRDREDSSWWVKAKDRTAASVLLKKLNELSQTVNNRSV